MSTKNKVKIPSDAKPPPYALRPSPPAPAGHRGLQTHTKTVATYRRRARCGEWDTTGWNLPLFVGWPADDWRRSRNQDRLARFLREGHRTGPPLDGLSLLKGEKVFEAAHQTLWTQNWGWCLYWQLSSHPSETRNSDWYIRIVAVSKNQPCLQPSEGISFSEANSHELRRSQSNTIKNVFNYKHRRTWAFTSRQKKTQFEKDWMAELRLYLKDPAKIGGIDWRRLLTVRNTSDFKIDQRVSSKKYKNVVVWQRDDWCGNDLTGEEVQPWSDEMPAWLAHFASSIMTLGGRRV